VITAHVEKAMSKTIRIIITVRAVNSGLRRDSDVNVGPAAPEKWLLYKVMIESTQYVYRSPGPVVFRM
jgi:hypothetical protein